MEGHCWEPVFFHLDILWAAKAGSWHVERHIAPPTHKLQRVWTPICSCWSHRRAPEKFLSIKYTNTNPQDDQEKYTLIRVKVFRILKDDEHYSRFCGIEGIILGAGGEILSLPGHLKASRDGYFNFLNSFASCVLPLNCKKCQECPSPHNHQ